MAAENHLPSKPPRALASAASAEDNDADDQQQHQQQVAGGEPWSGLPADWSYRNKLILAPMVRVSTLPFRQLALEHGADIVYSEELIDHKVRTCVRSELPDGVIRFTTGGHSRSAPVITVFETLPGEPVVLQLGTSDPVRALEAASVVARDVRAIDINCGCPKPFSIQGGMGAALLRDPERLADILRTLRRNLSIPVTCKIRLLDTPVRSLELLRVVEQAGAQAVAVHARFVPDRPYVPALPELVAPLAAAARVPLIYNGDAWRPAEFQRLRETTGCDSLMLARGALWNASVFATAKRGGRRRDVQDEDADAEVVRSWRPENLHNGQQQQLGQEQEEEALLPVWDVGMRLLDLADRYRGVLQTTRYCLQEMLKPHKPRHESFSQLARAKSLPELREALEQLGTTEPRFKAAYRMVEPDWKTREEMHRVKAAQPDAGLLPAADRGQRLTKQQRKRAREWSSPASGQIPEDHADLGAGEQAMAVEAQQDESKEQAAEVSSPRRKRLHRAGNGVKQPECDHEAAMVDDDVQDAAVGRP